MDINFELYKIFYHTAREGSFSAAAERLYITQSAVSQAVRNLEEKLGQVLFSRKKRNITLTREGEVLFEYISQAFNFIKTGESRLDELKKLDSGVVRLGAGDTVCKYFLVPVMEKFLKVHPNIKFKVINRTSSQLISALKNGVLDLCVVTLPVDDPLVEITDFLSVEDIFIASMKFGSLKGRKLTLEELCRLPLLLLQKESSTRRNLDTFFREKNVMYAPEIELESIDLLVDFARIGMGAAHVLKESALPAIERSELFELKTGIGLPKRQLGLATMKNVALSNAAAGFSKLLTPEFMKH